MGVKASEKEKKKTQPKLNFMTALEYKKKRELLLRQPTGTPIDDLIGGGIEQTEVVEFYGAYESSKTQICLTLAVEVAHSDGDVIYVDTEDTFRPERVWEIAENRKYNPETILSKIHLCQCLTTKELESIFKKIPKKIAVKMLIIDSLTALYREEYVGRGRLSDRQGVLRQFVVALKNYVREKQCYCACTNQVSDDPGAGPFMPLYIKQKGCGGNTLYHIINHRIFLRRGKGVKRVARLVSSCMYPEGEVVFQITARGVEAVPEDTDD